MDEKRLIDAYGLESDLLALFEFFGSLPCSEEDKVTQYTIKRCIGEVKKMPTVDAVEVVHGRWIQSEPGYRLCSHCMADVAIYSGHTNYCPNCGADMRGDGNG